MINVLLTCDKTLKRFHPNNRENCINADNNDAVRAQTGKNVSHGDEDDPKAGDRVKETNKSKTT